MTSVTLSDDLVEALRAEVRRVKTVLMDARLSSDPVQLMAAAIELDGLCNKLNEALGVPPSSHAEPPLSDEAFEAMLDRLLAAVGSNAVLHRRYMGKAMADDVYTSFANVRDVIIPELRERLLRQFSETSLPEARTKPTNREEAREMLAQLLGSEGRRQVLEADGKVACDQVAVHSSLTGTTIPWLRQQLLNAATLHRLAR